MRKVFLLFLLVISIFLLAIFVYTRFFVNNSPPEVLSKFSKEIVNSPDGRKIYSYILDDDRVIFYTCGKKDLNNIVINVYSFGKKYEVSLLDSIVEKRLDCFGHYIFPTSDGRYFFVSNFLYLIDGDKISKYEDVDQYDGEYQLWFNKDGKRYLLDLLTSSEISNSEVIVVPRYLIISSNTKKYFFGTHYLKLVDGKITFDNKSRGAELVQALNSGKVVDGISQDVSKKITFLPGVGDNAESFTSNLRNFSVYQVCKKFGWPDGGGCTRPETIITFDDQNITLEKMPLEFPVGNNVFMGNDIILQFDRANYLIVL